LISARKHHVTETRVNCLEVSRAVCDCGDDVRVLRWCQSAVRASFSTVQQPRRKISTSWKTLSKLRWNLKPKLNFTGKMVCYQYVLNAYLNVVKFTIYK